jgi:hypothetical protein
MFQSLRPKECIATEHRSNFTFDSDIGSADRKVFDCSGFCYDPGLCHTYCDEFCSSNGPRTKPINQFPDETSELVPRIHLSEGPDLFLNSPYHNIHTNISGKLQPGFKMGVSATISQECHLSRAILALAFLRDGGFPGGWMAKWTPPKR